MRSVKRIVALLMAVAMMVLCLAGCADKGKTLMELDGSKLSVNLFEFYLSRWKGTLCTASYFGSSALEDSFWDTWMSVTDKTTYNTYHTKFILEEAKSYLAAVALFEEEGLKLPDSYVKDIDEELQRLVADEADGSKTAFNAIIGEFGINYEMLREAYIIEAKIAYLQEHLFGKDYSKIGANLIEEYYQDNYARFKQVFLYTYEYVYETDENGDTVYYTSDNRISYDTTKTAKTDENGDYVTDKKGDRVYVYTDEDGKERIAYKRDGAHKENLMDSNGDPVVRKYNDTEMELVTDQAKDILAQVEKGDTITFDSLVTKHSEDVGLSDYPNGYYVTKDTAYESPEVIEALFEMEVGDVRMIKSDYGFHIFMKYKLEESAYTKSEYDDIFISTKTGTYTFMDKLAAQLLADYLAPYKEKIVVNEELLEGVDIKSAGVNYYY